VLGKRSKQKGLFKADNMFLEYVGKDTLYGFLAEWRNKLFNDEDFADLYCEDNGRKSVPPSILATALILQTFDKVSDEEAKNRADFDMRWKVALGIDMNESPFAKSTLQLFRSQLIVNKEHSKIFQKSIDFAKETGYLKKRKIKAALDTTNIFGRGAVKDTYNLLADGIKNLIRKLSELEDKKAEEWAAENDFSLYFGSSIKGEVEVNWDDQKSRENFLKNIVVDSKKLLEITKKILLKYDSERPMYKEIIEASKILTTILLQDVEPKEDGEGVQIKKGVAKDRLVSVHDPEMRHGRKSSSNRYNGHKASIVVDTDSQIILNTKVLTGNAPDNEDALEQVEESERRTGCEIEEVMGDCAYGDGETRKEFNEAGRKLIAKVPRRPNKKNIPKEDFTIDLENSKIICPEGVVCEKYRWKTDKYGKGKKYRVKQFEFDASICQGCKRYKECVKGWKNKRGRTVKLHPQEDLIQKAREFQKSDNFKEYKIRRQVVEHRIARLIQLGMRKARYFGRVKTHFQLMMAAAVANFTLVLSKAGTKDLPRKLYFFNFLLFVSNMQYVGLQRLFLHQKIFWKNNDDYFYLFTRYRNSVQKNFHNEKIIRKKESFH